MTCHKMTDLKRIVVEKKVAYKKENDTAFKYNSVQLNRLAKHLDLCCLEKKTITYLEAADAIDLAAPKLIHQVTQLLETLIENDQRMGQPIRSALVVSRTKSGLPGEGFFLKAMELGLMSGISANVFHQQCINRLFDD